MPMVPNATNMALLHGGVGGLLYSAVSGIGLSDTTCHSLSAPSCATPMRADRGVPWPPRRYGRAFCRPAM
jgi:hypothetical protein